MIQAQHISKSFHNIKVVNDVSLKVDKGKIFGLLGPNGAGKTTLIRMLSGIIKTDTGDALVNQLSTEKAKPYFGYVAQHFGQYEELSVRENVEFYAQMYNVEDKQWLDTLIHRYGLTPYQEHFAGTLSGGYQRRLALVCALAHNPKVLFLDEPTAGIDPVTRKLLWDDFYKLSAEGKTLFITTHYMEEAQRCHELAFLSAGKLVATGTPSNIKDALGEVYVYTTTLEYIPQLHTALQNLEATLLVNQFGEELRVILKNATSKTLVEETINAMTSQPCTLHETNANLEDVFIALTQEEESSL